MLPLKPWKIICAKAGLLWHQKCGWNCLHGHHLGNHPICCCTAQGTKVSIAMSQWQAFSMEWRFSLFCLCKQTLRVGRVGKINWIVILVKILVTATCQYLPWLLGWCNSKQDSSWQHKICLVIYLGFLVIFLSWNILRNYQSIYSFCPWM